MWTIAPDDGKVYGVGGKGSLGSDVASNLELILHDPMRRVRFCKDDEYVNALQDEDLRILASTFESSTSGAETWSRASIA